LTGPERKTFTENILEVTLDETFFYDLETAARDILVEERSWVFLNTLNESLSRGASDSYASAKSLAGITDFGGVVNALYVGDDTFPFEEHPFAHRERYKNVSRIFFVDYPNNNLYLTSGSGTIHLNYKPTFGTITSATTLTFPPARFHRLLGYYVAGYHQGGVDFDSIASRMSPENKLQMILMRNAMVRWDMQLQASQMGYRTGDGQVYLNPNHPDYLDTDAI
jgi:hypothetical protein